MRYLIQSFAMASLFALATTAAVAGKWQGAWTRESAGTDEDHVCNWARSDAQKQISDAGGSLQLIEDCKCKHLGVEGIQGRTSCTVSIYYERDRVLGMSEKH